MAGSNNLKIASIIVLSNKCNTNKDTTKTKQIKASLYLLLIVNTSVIPSKTQQTTNE